MGGKSRKTGNISKKLIDRIKNNVKNPLSKTSEKIPVNKSSLFSGLEL